jgi:hypothetical protein
VSHLSNISLRTSNHLWHIDNQSHGLGSPRRGSWIVWQSHLGLAFCKLAFLDVLDYMCTITLFLDLKHTAYNCKTILSSCEVIHTHGGDSCSRLWNYICTMGNCRAQMGKIEKWNAKEAAANTQVANSSSTC